MQCEEYLSCYDLMRIDRDRLQRLADENAGIAAKKQKQIEDLIAEFALKEKKRLEGKKDVGTMANI